MFSGYIAIEQPNFIKHQNRGRKIQLYRVLYACCYSDALQCNILKFVSIIFSTQRRYPFTDKERVALGGWVLTHPSMKERGNTIWIAAINEKVLTILVFHI